MTFAVKKRSAIAQYVVEHLFMLCAFTAILALLLVTFFLFYSGLPALIRLNPAKFLFGGHWRPSAEQFGIWPMFAASALSTLGAVSLATLVGVMTALFMTHLAPKWAYRILRPCVQLLAGIPSVVYGFFGLTVLVPLVRNLFGGPGNSLLAVILILAMMIAPTIISLSENAIRAVPREYRENSLALGVTHIQSLFRVVLPAAKSGVLSSVVLGAGRAVGETMAVLLVAGNRPIPPTSPLDPVRTMTGNIALEMSYATGIHREALFATGVVLFFFIIALNGAFYALAQGREKR